jgi:glycosyltransferase involved in cell wall biosynthesis
MKKISIITPCFNEAENVKECFETVRQVMQEMLPNYEYEHIFADNSSTDNSWEVLKEIASKDPRVKLIRNSRNVGPFRNMWNAMKHTSGDAVVPLVPADLQDPPKTIPDLVRNWESGDLLVYGVRKQREEALVMRFARNLYYKVVERFADFYVPPHAGEFLLADRRVVDSVLETDDSYPYIRGLFAQTGVRSSQVTYTWVRRKRGQSRNSLIDLIDQAINGFVSTSRLPARAALLGGFLMSLLGVFAAILFLVLFLFDREQVQLGVPTLVVTIFMYGGLQLFFLGLIGEYVLSVHGQVRRAPRLFEIETVNL